MAIQYFLTDVGRDVALNATSLGLNVSLSHIAVGTAKYDPLTALDRTALVAEVERYPLNGGGVEPNSHTLRFVTSIEPTITVDGFEIGIFTDTGALFAIASTTGNDPLIRLVANIVAISSFGMILSTINLTNLIITVDPNTPICVALMNQHLDHPDPHPQYSKKVTTITAGAGLTGGGDLSGNRTITLGTPSTITSWSGNEVSGSTHTHELGVGAVTNAKIADGAVTNSKIVSVDYSKITNAPAQTHVVDNLTSTSTTSALSANQGRVLNEAKFDKAGGAITGDLSIKGQTYARAVWVQSSVNNSNMVMSIDSSTNQVLFQHSPISGAGGFKFDKGLEAKTEVKSEMLKVDNVNNITTISHQFGGGRSLFHTDCNVFEFDKDVYFGSVQKGTNGYTTLPNGLIMQWGRFDTTMIEGPVNIILPIAFPNNCLNAQATRISAGSNNVDSDGGVLYVSSNQITIQFNLQGWYGDSKANLRGINWMAIGY